MDKIRDWLLIALLGLVCFLFGQEVFQPTPAEAESDRQYAVIGGREEANGDVNIYITQEDGFIDSREGVLYAYLPGLLKEAAKQGWTVHTITTGDGYVFQVILEK